MNSQKFIIGTLVGGITFFFLGYLFYGLLLTNFFTQHSVAPPGSMKSMEEIVWWALILGNFVAAALLTYVFLKLGNVNSFGSGARTGAAIGFFVALGIGLVRYGTSNSGDLTAVCVSVVVEVVRNGIAGGVIAAVLGRGAKKA